MPLLVLAAAAVSVAVLVGAAPAAASPVVSVVARTLNAPKHLAFGPGGHLYFAVSGSAGDVSPPCVLGVGPQGTRARFCAGGDGAIEEVLASGAVKNVFPKIPSTQQMNTGAVTGVDAVTFYDGHLVVLSGNAEPNQSGETPFSPGSDYAFGVLREQGQPEVAYTVRVHGRKVTRYRLPANLYPGAGISRFAASHPQSPATVGGPPGTKIYNSDPSDVVAYHGGYAVTDAGANDVLLVSSTGRVSLAARLPTRAETAPAGSLGPDSSAQTIDAQAAPSSLTVGPGGALYVAITRNVPGLPGSAEIDRVIPGHTPTPVVTGLTSVSDLAFTKTGTLLILQANRGAPNTHGALLSATLNPTTPVTATDLDLPGLINPTGLAISARGNIFISNNTIGDGKGQILKVSGLLN